MTNSQIRDALGAPDIGAPFQVWEPQVVWDSALSDVRRLIAADPIWMDTPNYEAGWLVWLRYNPRWMSRRLKRRLRTPIKWIVDAALGIDERPSG